MASEGDDDDDVFSAYAWETKPWGSCSAACGPGVRARQVTCVHPCSLIYGCPEVAAELCLDSKPAEEEACQLAVCTTTVATTRTYVTSSSSTVTTRTSTTVTNTLEGNWQHMARIQGRRQTEYPGEYRTPLKH
ncbi:unnamed protein product [Prorocentrum cordatum]|uniref:Uncharacterized protein n=1 Tax=Prorocentrum cordatum TaxID=2364126 RepID=A0ABN9VJG6_9DINO|nr:unnamed protein product [Polarella glacialis]